MTYNLTEKISNSLDNWGDHPVYIEISKDKKAAYISAPQFKEKITSTTQFLIRSGVQKRFIVILFLKNSSDFPAIFLSLITIGAVPVPSKLEYRKLELEEIFLNADPHVVITEREHLPILAPYMKNRIVLTKTEEGLSFYSKPDIAALPDTPDIPDYIASINYTYRGYGYPLGALVPHGQYILGAEVLQDGVKLKRGGILLNTIPMSHIFTLIGCICLPLLVGTTLVIHNTMRPFTIFEDIQKYKINYILSVPVFYNLLLKFLERQYDISSLEEILSGGCVLNETDFKNITEGLNARIVHGYGLTEFTPVSRHIVGEARVNTIGPVCKGIEYKIDAADKEGNGELLIKTEHMTKKYYKRPKESKDAFEDGWFKTGDICRLDDGHLVFIKEKKKTCKINGNIADLEEVRRVLLACKGIKDAVVRFDRNRLYAKVKVDPSADIQGIKAGLKDMIAGYKIPMLEVV